MPAAIPRKGPWLLFIAAALAAATGAHGALILNPPRPIEYQLKVQLIQTAHNDGSPVATAFGSPSQRAHIERRVNDIWAQAGIEVDFENSINRLNNTTAYGSAANINQLVSLANSAGALSDDPFALNLFLVNRVPGYNPHSPLSVAGLAKLNSNGIALFVGSSLLGSGGNRDLVARVAAHEIGHNLGLSHAAGGGNLMSISGGTAQLTQSQVFQALNSYYVRPQPTLAGDFNGDGRVDAADYTEWRDGFGSIYGRQDYLDWRANFGATRAASPVTAQLAPEPTSALLLLVGAWWLVVRRSPGAAVPAVTRVWRS